MYTEKAALAQRDAAHTAAKKFEASCGAYVTFPVGFDGGVRVYATTQIPDGRRLIAVPDGDRITFAVIERAATAPVDDAGLESDPVIAAAAARILAAKPSLGGVQRAFDEACEMIIKLRAAA